MGERSETRRRMTIDGERYLDRISTDKLIFLDRISHLDEGAPMADTAVLLRPLRTRILGMLAEPQSAAGIARTLDVARQKVGYHLKELEKQGLVELVEEKKVGNCVERVVRAT